MSCLQLRDRRSLGRKPRVEIRFLPTEVGRQTLFRIEPARQRRDLICHPIGLSGPFLLPSRFAFRSRRPEIRDHPTLRFEVGGEGRHLLGGCRGARRIGIGRMRFLLPASGGLRQLRAQRVLGIHGRLHPRLGLSGRAAEFRGRGALGIESVLKIRERPLHIADTRSFGIELRSKFRFDTRLIGDRRVLGIESLLQTRERAFEIGSGRLFGGQALLHLGSHAFELGAGGLIRIDLRLQFLVRLPQLCVGLALPAELGDRLVVDLGDVFVRIPRVGLAAPEERQLLGGLLRRPSQLGNRVAFHRELRLRFGVRALTVGGRLAARAISASSRSRTAAASAVLVFQRARLRVEAIEFLSKTFCQSAFGRQVAPGLVDGPFQLRGRSFQFGSGGSLFREIDLEGLACLLEAFLFFVLQHQDPLLRLFQRVTHVSARREFLIDGGLRRGASLRDVHLGFEPRIRASLYRRGLRLLARHPRKIENQRLERVAARRVRERGFERREANLHAAAKRIESTLRRLGHIHIW